MAIKACRECGGQVSTKAEICPHCGVRSPTGNPFGPSEKKRRFGCLWLFIIVIGASAIIGALTEHKMTPEELAQKQKRDAEFSVDFKELSTAGALAVATGDANRLEISGWNSSLDLYLGPLSAAKAASLSAFLCTNYFKTRLKSRWKVRVYLVNETVAAECEIR